MARYTSHGGQCCGAGHIYGFSASDAENVRSLEAEINKVPSGRLTEIILNDNQCRNNPRLLQRMADFGFVYVARWINNNHNSHVNCFHRADRRHRLDHDRWNWPGQVIQPTMHGELARLPNFPQPAQINRYPVYNRFLGFQRGDRVRINSPRSRRNGMELNIRYLRTVYDYWGGNDRAVAEFIDPTNGRPFNISINNLVRIGPAAPPPAPPPPPHVPEVPPQLHVIA